MTKMQKQIITGGLMWLAAIAGVIFAMKGGDFLADILVRIL